MGQLSRKHSGDVNRFDDDGNPENGCEAPEGLESLGIFIDKDTHTLMSYTYKPIHVRCTYSMSTDINFYSYIVVHIRFRVSV